MLKRIQGCCFTLLVLLLFCCPLAVSAAGTVEAAAWAKVEDGAQLLDEQQLEQLQTQAQQLADQTGFIVFIKTTTSTGGLEVRRYLADQYELAGGSDNQKAILLGIDMGGREVATPQASEDYFPVKKTNAMVDSVLDHLGDGNYQRAMEIFLAQAEDTIVNYGVKPVGKIVGVSLGVGAVVALISVGTLVWMHPRIEGSAVSASRYMGKSRIQLHRREDRFVHSFTTRRTIQRDNGSSGSSGGSFSSSSASFLNPGPIRLSIYCASSRLQCSSQRRKVIPFVLLLNFSG